MIIVVEGIKGSGKSTLCKNLSTHLKWPVYRAFRTDSDDHDPGLTLRLTGIPTNTWLEDLFAADVLTSIGANAILDRSMVSGMAYDELRPTWTSARMPAHAKATAWQHWTQQMASSGALIIYLHKHLAVVTRENLAETRALKPWLKRAMSAGIQAAVIDTSRNNEARTWKLATEKILQVGTLRHRREQG